MSLSRLAALALALALSAPAMADPPSAPMRWLQGAKAWVGGLWQKDAAAWLERIGPALREQNYQGTLVMVSGNRMDTLAVYHAFADGRERMRLLTVSGPHREVVRDDKLVMVIGAGLPVGYDADTGGRWNPAEQFARAGALKSYQARLGGSGRVAGRDAQIIELSARDDWRYSFRLWLDKDTALPLRIALIGSEGKPLEQMAFTELTLGQAPDEADLQPSTRQGLRRIQTLSPGRETDPGWRVATPPPGFELRAARRLGASVQLLYSDGLANVSVYIEPTAGRQRGESVMHRGAVNAHSVWQGGRRVVAIGKVPAATVAQFVRGVRAPAGTPVSGG